MIDRIFKNWRTSLIGVALIFGALALVWIDRATLTEAGAFIAIGVPLFFAKDGKTSKTKRDE